MKVWIDILTPKQGNFFSELHHRLNAKGHKTILTTREYREVNELLELKGLKAIEVGHHGGVKLKDKLVESAKRVWGLAEVMEQQKPDIAISFASPEAARAAFGLNIPHYCVSDSPHAEAVSKLTIPLSEKLFTPWIIPLYAWKRYGMNPRDIVRYRALDPIVWLSGFKGNPKVTESLKLDLSKPIIVVRPPEEYAAYLRDYSSAASGKVVDLVARVLDLNEVEGQVVVLPRYTTQSERFRKRFGNKIIVPDHIIDAVSLMQVSSVVVGGGGTMTAEAALLGVPAISYYPGEPTFVEKFLVNYGLVERILDPTRVAQRTVAISKSQDFREFYKKKSAKLVSSMEDPVRVIFQRIFKR